MNAQLAALAMVIAGQELENGQLRARLHQAETDLAAATARLAALDPLSDDAAGATD